PRALLLRPGRTTDSPTADRLIDGNMVARLSRATIAYDACVMVTKSAADGDTAEPLREVRGVVERITFQNPDNGYTVARLAPDRHHAPEREDDEATPARGPDELVTLVGTLVDLTPGEAIVATGWWRRDAKYGWQFAVVDFQTVLPATLQGME